MKDTLSRLLVLVPKPNTAAERRIARGSGVVSHVSDIAADRIVASFEGNLYNAQNLQRFDDRVHHAADRLIANYPTVAVGMFSRDDFLVVGSFNPQTGVLDITNADAVESWCLLP